MRYAIALALFVTLAALPSSAQATYDASISLTAPDRLSDDSTADLRVAIANQGDQPILNAFVAVSGYPYAVALRIDAPAGWSCPPPDSPDLLTCYAASIAPHSQAAIVVHARFPQHELRANFSARLYSLPDDKTPIAVAQYGAVFYRIFTVTNDADSGEGSLRHAIADMNSSCGDERTYVPCRIDFAAPFTIAAASPLPMIVAPDGSVDGGGRVKLRREGTWSGEGIAFFSAVADVEGMDIAGFDGAAIRMFGRPQQINGSTRSRIAGNRITGNTRGVMATDHPFEITGNTIGGNVRSAIFIGSTYYTVITNNRIGLDADGTPLPNGASGIFINEATSVVNTLIERNIIANNREFGIALGFPPRHIELGPNQFYANGRAVDVGLNGVTGDNAPAITSAVYDPASGDTIISGQLTNVSLPYDLTVYVYANTTLDADGYAEGEQFLGTAKVAANGFTLRHHGDLRGRYVDAITSILIDWEVQSYWTSEFGPPLQVE